MKHETRGGVLPMKVFVDALTLTPRASVRVRYSPDPTRSISRNYDRKRLPNTSRTRDVLVPVKAVPAIGDPTRFVIRA